MTNALTLREIAQSILDRHQMSGRELSRVAAKHGLTLSHTTINALAAGAYKSRPTDKTLKALVALSDYTEEQVYEAAGAPLPARPLADDLPPEADSLTGDQRLAVIAVVRQFAKANRALAQLERKDTGHDHPPMSRAAVSAAPDDEPTPPTADEYGLAAKHAPRERAYDDQSAEGDE